MAELHLKACILYSESVGENGTAPGGGSRSAKRRSFLKLWEITGETMMQHDAPTRFDRLAVAHVMETQVQVAHPQTKADVIASMMIEGFGAVPVVDDQRRLIGIVSEHDLLASLDRKQKWSEVTAQDVMARNPYSVRPEMDIATLVHVLRASGLIRVPVVDAHDKLLGIVARRDVLRAYLSSGSATGTSSVRA